MRGFIFGVLMGVMVLSIMGAQDLYTYYTQQAVNKLAVDYPQANQLWMDNGDDNRDSLIATNGASEYSIYSETAAAPCTFTVYYTIADTANSFILLSDGHSWDFDQGPAADSIDVDRADATKYAIVTWTF